MERAVVDGLTLEYDVSGTGESIVLIHGSFIADTFRPLVVETALTRRYRLLTYHRRGYAGSSQSERPLSIPEQAADCFALLRHLGIGRLHVVGHSFGGAVALQMALDAPATIRSLALLEPALMVGATGESYRESLALAIRHFRETEPGLVVNEFLEARWPGYRAPLEEVLPGAFEQAVSDAWTTFEIELPGLLEWTFGEAEARRIPQPVLSVLGGDSDALWARFGETHRWLLSSLPNAESYVLPGTTHFLQMQNPRDMAEALTAFYTRHTSTR